MIPTVRGVQLLLLEQRHHKHYNQGNQNESSQKFQCFPVMPIRSGDVSNEYLMTQRKGKYISVLQQEEA